MTRASVRQVAEHAGVSAMTVSRIVRGRHEAVSPEKKARVLAAMRELDYVPVRPTLQNRHSETRIIGLIVDDIFSYKGLVAPNTLEGLRETAFALHYDVLLLHSRPVSSLDEQKIQLLDRRCDGFIFVSPKEREEVFENLVKHGFPTVSCYSADVPEGIAWVTPDNEGAMHQAVGTLQELGHRNIVFIAGPHEQSSAFHRCEAYITAMNTKRLSPRWIEMTSYEESAKAVEFVLQQQATAVICHNDYWALSLWEKLNEQGVNVPHEVSIIGVDNIPDSEARGLTTFINPYQKIGQVAVESLLQILQGGDVSEHCHRLPMEMVTRRSVAPPRPS